MTTIKGLFSPIKKSRFLLLKDLIEVKAQRLYIQFPASAASNLSHFIEVKGEDHKIQFHDGWLYQKLHVANLVELVPEISEVEAEVVVEEPASDVVAMEGSKTPIVILFGWAGASQKNLSKYASIYVEAGYTTAQYILPTRHIFRDTDQVPELMSRLIEQLKQKNLLNRPMYIHCLSDTGVMCYQGMDIASKQSSTVLDVKGVVWDSCPGPYPEVTLSRVIAFLIVNWMCCYKDKMGVIKSLYSSYRLLLDRGWPNLLRRWQGKPVTLNLIDGIWCGHFGRDHHLQHPEVSELFLYSNKDFYLPFKYLEKEVLEVRQESEAHFSYVKFKDSPHVSHLKRYRKEYKNTVLSFIESTRDDLEEKSSVPECNDGKYAEKRKKYEANVTKCKESVTYKQQRMC